MSAGKTVSDDDLKRMLELSEISDAEHVEELGEWHDAFQKLHDWLEDDRDRRKVVIRSGNMTVWWVGLYIEERCISGTSNEGGILEMIDEALEGMVIQERGGIEVKTRDLLDDRDFENPKGTAQ